MPMPFVHSLVRLRRADQRGWCAPVELGESAPHYLSFVLPVDPQGAFFTTYSCETVTVQGSKKVLDRHELATEGNASFVLRLAGKDLWFAVKPPLNGPRRLPYVGGLKHPDFEFLFTEIEPRDGGQLDALFDRDRTFIIGCDPYTHYAGIEQHA